MATFRKSKKIGGVRLTLSKSGLSASTGVKGARISANTKGEVHRTISAPGTGIYDRKKIAGPSGKKSRGEAPTTPETPLTEQAQATEVAAVETASPEVPTLPPLPAEHVGPVVEGYGCQVSYDGAVLHAQGTNRAAKAALAGDGWRDGVTVTREQIASIDLKPAGRMTNGNLVLHLTDGRKAQLHYLRKHQGAFDDLAARLAG